MNTNDRDRLDLATSARLAKLANRPVDTSRLEQRLDRVLHEQMAAGTRPPRSLVWGRWWRPLAAAAVLFALSIGWFVLEGGTSPAIAAPAGLAQIHYEVANGLTPLVKVSTVGQANQFLAEQSNSITPIPELPGQLRSCCLHQHAGATLTCILIERDDQLITVALAQGAKLHPPTGRTIMHDGRQFSSHTANGVNMVMAQEGDLWLCVMGEVPPETLVDVAAAIRM